MFIPDCASSYGKPLHTVCLSRGYNGRYSIPCVCRVYGVVVCSPCGGVGRGVWVGAVNACLQAGGATTELSGSEQAKAAAAANGASPTTPRHATPRNARTPHTCNDSAMAGGGWRVTYICH